jgi:hypothetical protein
MTRLTLDAATLAQLNRLSGPCELCDDQGHVLGYFTPCTDLAIYEGVDSPTDDQELARRSREGGGRPLAEIISEF